MPWIRKDEATIEQGRARRRWSPWRALIWFVVFFVGAFPMLVHYRIGGVDQAPLTVAAIASVIVALAISAVLSTFRMVFGESLIACYGRIMPKVDICPECLTATRKGQRLCHCDCFVEPIEHWTYVDE